MEISYSKTFGWFYEASKLILRAIAMMMITKNHILSLSLCYMHQISIKFPGTDGIPSHLEEISHNLLLIVAPSLAGVHQ